MLPSVPFVRGLRIELGVLAKTESSLALAEDRLICAATDESPIDQQSFSTFNGRLASGRNLIIGGAYRPHNHTADGEALRFIYETLSLVREGPAHLPNSRTARVRRSAAPPPPAAAPRGLFGAHFTQARGH